MNELIESSLRLLSIVRVVHWKTQSYSEHIALGDFYDRFSETLDKFVETWQGSTRSRISTINIDSVEVTDSTNISKELKIVDEILTDIDNVTTDVMNIRDELLGHLNKLKYLLTLK